jgi:hypothetical protein
MRGTLAIPQLRQAGSSLELVFFAHAVAANKTPRFIGKKAQAWVPIQEQFDEPFVGRFFAGENWEQGR